MEDWRYDGRRRRYEEKRGVPKFFGVVVGYNHCRTIPRSLLAGTLPTFPFLSRESCFFLFLSLSLVDTKIPFSPPSYFVSRHCPFQFPRDCGANAARYRINFLSRGCRDFTLLERRHWGGPRYSWKPPRRLGGWYFGLVSRLGVRVKSSREEN